MAHRLKPAREEPRPRQGQASQERTTTMRKATGAVIAMCTVGTAMMTLLGPVLGPSAEAATLALMGVGLFVGSSVLSSGDKVTMHPSGMAKEA